MDLDGLAGAVGPLLVEAGDLALRHFRTDAEARDKAAGRDGAAWDPVTDADEAVEAYLRHGLETRFPDHQIVGEEHGTTGPADAVARWFIDPIDGTKAFVTGMTAWGVLVGLVVQDHPVAGWLRQPYLGETFAAVAGQGWFERCGLRRPLRTRATTDLASAVLYSTHPSMFTTVAERAAYERVAGQVRLARFGGDCYSYALLAIGQIDLILEASLQPYDVVPLVPIVEAAGGTITDRHGQPPLGGGFVVAAGTAELHARALALVNGASPGPESFGRLDY